MDLATMVRDLHNASDDAAATASIMQLSAGVDAAPSSARSIARAGGCKPIVQQLSSPCEDLQLLAGSLLCDMVRQGAGAGEVLAA
jgi:hypothetical protein